jgi:hypothetical protein
MVRNSYGSGSHLPLQGQSWLKEGGKLQYWWEIDEQIEGCMWEKGYRYVQAEAIIP